MNGYAKRLIATGLIVSVLACGVSACNGKTPDGTSSPTEASDSLVEWVPSERNSITDPQQAIFDKACSRLVGVRYTPIAYMGTQISSGTNHCFLTISQSMSPVAQPSYIMIYIHEGMDGTTSILGFQDITYSGIPGSTPILTGEWKYNRNPAITDDVVVMMDKVTEKLTGATYYPLAYLGTETVEGIKHAILCKAVPVVRDSNQPGSYVVVIISEDQNGNYDMTDTITVKLGDYKE